MMRRGFTLWEMLTVIILLGAVGLILSRLFTATHRVIDAAPKARDQIVRVDGMLRQMREDVWRARSVRVDAPKLFSADSVVWSIAEDTIVRTEGHERREFAGVDAEFSFESLPAGVLLRNGKSDSDDSILMASHARLLATNRGAP